MTSSRVLIVGPSSLLTEGVATLFRKARGFVVTIISPEEESGAAAHTGAGPYGLEARIARLRPDVLVLVDTPEAKRGSGRIPRLLEEAGVPIVLCVNPDEPKVRIYSERQVPAQSSDLLAAVRGLFPSGDSGPFAESPRKRTGRRGKL